MVRFIKFYSFPIDALLGLFFYCVFSIDEIFFNLDIDTFCSVLSTFAGIFSGCYVLCW